MSSSSPRPHPNPLPGGEGTRRGEGTRGNFPAAAGTPGQAESRAGLAELAESVTAEAQPWWPEFRQLLREGWYWRHAALIAWEASPTQGRWPATQAELATEVLKLKSDRAIADWKKKHPIDEAVARMAAAPLLRHRRDIYEALVASASNPDPRCHPDRKLSLEMLGDYTPRSAVRNEVEVEVVTDAREQLARLLGADAAEGADPGGAGPAER